MPHARHEWREYASGACFSEFATVCLHLAHLSERFSVVVCCWNGGQASPPHTHGGACASWTRVLHGQARGSSSISLFRCRARPPKRGRRDALLFFRKRR